MAASPILISLIANKRIQTLTNRLRNTDPRVLDDLANASETAKEFHRAKAHDEAMRIFDKYKGTPSYLKLISLYLAEQTDKALSKHIQALEAAKPENQRDALLRKQIKAEVLAELGMTEDDYNG